MNAWTALCRAIDRWTHGRFGLMAAMILILFLAALLTACATSRITSDDLTLAERFEMHMFRDDAGEPLSELWKQTRPLRIAIRGDRRYEADVLAHARILGDVTGLPVEIVDYYDLPEPTISVAFWPKDKIRSLADERFKERFGGRPVIVECWTDVWGDAGYFRHEVYIQSDLTPAHTRSCIAQEMSHGLGPSGDLDGPFGSRDDTVFASYDGAEYLTPQDISVLRILYDDRLYSGMPREEVLAVLPQIIADVAPGS